MGNYLFKVVGTLLIISGLAACGSDDCHQVPQNVEVGLYAGNALTRTVMGQDGLSASWSEGDELALWAKDQSGSYVLSNQKFYTYGIDGKDGFFTSVLSSAMPEASYTYYCCYPAPISVSGSKVSFNVPSVQDGKVSQGADIMISDPVQHGALKPVSDLGEESPMKMNMNRITSYRISGCRRIHFLCVSIETMCRMTCGNGRDSYRPPRAMLSITVS